ncbi:MAG: DNA primase [Aquifex sp.]|nr:MAG: DNA primase [Aquifex sp.]
MSSDIDELRREIDIVDVISEYLNLEKVGSNYRTNCPFHPDDTPSFYVSPSKQIFKCFGCGVGGDAIKFVSLYEDISYFEAALELAKRYGKKLDLERISKDEKIYVALDKVSDFYRSSLLKNKEASEYVRSRGIDPKVVKKFDLGYAPSSEELVKILKESGLLEVYIETKNLISPTKGVYRDLFLRRVVIPIRDPRGRVIGFGGRRIAEDNSPKYINSPDSRVFKKRDNLFGLYEAKEYIKEEGFAILVEGYFDLLRLFSERIRNVVAPLGTALTQNQATLLSKFTKKVYLLYDGDAAGRKAMKSAIPLLLKAGLEVYPVYLPEGYDPDEFIKEFGREKLKELINNSEEVFQLIIKTAEENFEEKTKEFRYYLSFVPDGVKRFALASEFHTKYKVPMDILLVKPEKIPQEGNIKLSFKEKVFLKGLLEMKPKIDINALDLSPTLKGLALKALNGEDHLLPKEVLEYNVDNLEKLFNGILKDFQKCEKKKKKDLKNVNT